MLQLKLTKGTQHLLHLLFAMMYLGGGVAMLTVGLLNGDTSTSGTSAVLFFFALLLYSFAIRAMPVVQSKRQVYIAEAGLASCLVGAVVMLSFGIQQNEPGVAGASAALWGTAAILFVIVATKIKAADIMLLGEPSRRSSQNPANIETSSQGGYSVMGCQFSKGTQHLFYLVTSLMYLGGGVAMLTVGLLQHNHVTAGTSAILFFSAILLYIFAIKAMPTVETKALLYGAEACLGAIVVGGVVMISIGVVTNQPGVAGGSAGVWSSGIPCFVYVATAIRNTEKGVTRESPKSSNTKEAFNTEVPQNV